MNEYRVKPFVRHNYKRRKVEVCVVIEYNALFPPLTWRGEPLEWPEEKARVSTDNTAIDLAIDPDYMKQTRDGDAVRLVDVEIKSVRPIDADLQP